MPLFLAGRSVNLIQYSESHDHKYYEVILTLEGEGISVIGGKEYPFSPGTIHIVPPDTLHSKESESGFRDIYFHTDTLQFGKTSEMSKNAVHEPIVLADDMDQTMKYLMKIILSRYLKLKKYDPLLESLYHVALQQLNEWYEKAPADSVVDDIIHRLTASFSDPEFAITDALYATGYSKDYVRRRFTAATGTTPGTYLTNLRIKYARQLLEHQSKLHLSVTEIGMMSGYYDVCYFSRIFRKVTGMSPTEYAAKYQD